METDSNVKCMLIKRKNNEIMMIQVWWFYESYFERKVGSCTEIKYFRVSKILERNNERYSEKLSKVVSSQPRRGVVLSPDLSSLYSENTMREITK